MKVFRFEETHSTLYYTEVIAENIEEAIEKAEADRCWEQDDEDYIESRAVFVAKTDDEEGNYKDIEIMSTSFDDLSEEDEKALENIVDYEEFEEDNEAYNKYKINR